MKTIEGIILTLQSQNLPQRFQAPNQTAQSVFVQYASADIISYRFEEFNAKFMKNALISFSYIEEYPLEECLQFTLVRFKKHGFTNYEWISEERKVKWVKTVNNEYSLTYNVENSYLGDLMNTKLPIINKIA